MDGLLALFGLVAFIAFVITVIKASFVLDDFYTRKFYESLAIDGEIAIHSAYDALSHIEQMKNPAAIRAVKELCLERAKDEFDYVKNRAGSISWSPDGYLRRTKEWLKVGGWSETDLDLNGATSLEEYKAKLYLQEVANLVAEDDADPLAGAIERLQIVIDDSPNKEDCLAQLGKLDIAARLARAQVALGREYLRKANIACTPQEKLSLLTGGRKTLLSWLPENEEWPVSLDEIGHQVDEAAINVLVAELRKSVCGKNISSFDVALAIKEYSGELSDLLADATRAAKHSE